MGGLACSHSVVDWLGVAVIHDCPPGFDVVGTTIACRACLSVIDVEVEWTRVVL